MKDPQPLLIRSIKPKMRFPTSTRYLLLPLLICFSGISLAGPPPPLPSPRSFHRAVPFEEKIFVFGGGTDQRFLILDLTKQEWTQHEAPFDQEPALGTAVAGEMVYVVDPFTPRLFGYDPEKGDWTELAPPPRARGNPTLVGYQGKLYLIGSYLNVPAENSVEIYDPKTDKWSSGPPLPEIEKEHHFHLAAVLDNRLHVVGYYFGGKSHWIFDGESWKPGAEAPLPCGWKMDALEAVDSGLILFKRNIADPKDEAKELPDEIFHYDPKADRWKAMGPLPKDYPLIVAANAYVDGKIYVFGGTPDPTAVFCYDVEKDIWERSALKKAE